MNRLNNKVALITGASKGIGASIAKFFAAEGAKVVVNYASSKEGADKVVKAITDNGGNIINISSEAGKTLLPTGSVYSATKAALDAITISLSKEFAGRNIRINSILPGVVETEGSHTAGFIGSDAETKLVANTPLGRTGQPEDIAKVAVFLASDESAWITGEKISVSGGIYGL